MKEESIFFNNEEIIKFISDNYSIDINNITIINRGTANIYLLDNKYILKEYQEKYKKDSIIKEINIIKYLFSNDFKVPEYIETINNQNYVEFKNRILILQKYIDGYTIKQNESNYEQVIESAKYLGILVKLLENYPEKLPVINVKEWYSKDNFEKTIEDYEKLLKKIDKNDKNYEKIKTDFEDKINIINELKNKDYSDFDKMSFKNSHGDYSIMQFIYKDNKIEAIIDFSASACMPISWEIIRSYSYIDKEFNIDNFVAYVKEFEKYVKLNKYDKENIALLYLIQIVNSLYGYRQYIEFNNNDLLEFAFFRTDLCRFLYKNYKKIGKII